MTPFPPADSDLPFYTVSQVAQLLDVQPAFLRRLDTEDVVRPGRSDGGQRRYSYVDITIVQRVVQLAGEGMTLPGIRRIFELEAEVQDLQQQLDTLRAKSKRSR